MILLSLQTMKAYILLAEGFETIEALTPLDLLRRCGVDVKLVSISDSLRVVSSHGLSVEADILLTDGADDGDMVILPGGYPGYENLRKSEAVLDKVRVYSASGKYVAAICGAPTVLLSAGIAKGRKITCHSSVLDEMRGDYNCTCADVEVDGKLITGKGAGLSLPFALALAETLAPADVVEKVKAGLQLI